MADKTNAPHGARGVLYAPAWHRPWLRYVEGEQGGGTGGEGTPQTGSEATGTDWKAKYEEAIGHSRKWEQRAKDNADAARRLADIENASKTAEQQNADKIAALEQKLAASERTALVARVQATHGISDEDAALFLTGADEAALTAQAKRLAERAPAGPVVPSEGTPNDNNSTSPERAFLREIFGD